MLTLNLVRAQNNSERFYNVSKYKAEITFDIKGNSSIASEYGKSNRTYHERYHCIFVTDTGTFQGVDLFQTDKERESHANDEVSSGDFLEGIDLDSVTQAMENSGFDLSMMNEVMNGMKDMNAAHVSFNKYKSWMANMAVGTCDVNYDLSGSFDENYKEYAGEGGGWCYHSYSESYQGSLHESYKPFDQNPMSIFFFLNLESNYYYIVFIHGLPDKFRIHGQWSSTNSCGDPDHGSIDKHIESMVYPAREKQAWIFRKAFPQDGMSINGSENITDSVIIRNSWKDADVDVNLKWNIFPASQEVPEVFISYNDEGKTWIPEDDNTVDAFLEWDASVKPEAIQWELTDVSSEPGTCMNSTSAETTKDLEFAEEAKALGYTLTKTDDGFMAEKTTDIKALVEHITINSKDFGAYGHLIGRIKVNGIWFDARQEEMGTYSLPVPWDKNENSIADKWEKDMGIFDRNYPATWDYDPFPGGQRSNGDGFSLYEEYRGFMEQGHVFRDGKHETVKDGHVRTDPMYKDVFVYDQDNLFREHYAQYNPADLNWHYIQRKQMKYTGNVEDDENRWVNYRTSGMYSNQRQYAMWIHYWPVTAGNETSAGESPRKESCGGEYPGEYPLRCIYMIKVQEQGILNALGSMSNSSEKNRLFGEILTTTVIHEVGHGLGIKHHYNNIGTDEADKDFVDLGVLDCAMRYETDTEVEHHEKMRFLKTRYCRKGETWTRLAKDQADGPGAHEIKMDTYPSHNCFWEINVKGGY